MSRDRRLENRVVNLSRPITHVSASAIGYAGNNYRYRISVKSQHKARRTCDLQCYFVTESFPYVPHTCYLRPGCRPNAGNCARYARLRVCCCDYFTAKKCK